MDSISVGRIVRFRSVRGEILPGIVTKVYEDDSTVDLTAFGGRFPFGTEAEERVPYEAPFTDQTTYRWWWPQDEMIADIFEEDSIDTEPEAVVE